MKKLLFGLPLILLVAIGCSQRSSQNSSEPKSQMDTKLSDSANSGFKTYSSSGVTFQYDPKTVAVSTQGNKIYLDDPTDAKKGVHTGDYIEVFSKNNNDSLPVAIWSTVLKGLSPQQCLVNVENNINYFSRFNVVDIRAANNSSSSSGSCRSSYVDVGSPGFFVYDPSHPSVFLFWRSGAAIDLKAIESTLQFIV